MKMKMYAYSCTWLNGIQGPYGKMLSLSVKTLPDDSTQTLEDTFESGFQVANHDLMLDIIKHYDMKRDNNRSAMTGWMEFRPVEDFGF
jgi:hypothetical protein